MAEQALTNIEDLIKGAVKAAVDEAIAEEEERAVQRVRERIRAQKATITMGILNHFDVYRDAHRIIITVRDTVEGVD